MKLVILLLAALPLLADEFVVEKLTPAEVDQLTAARNKLAEVERAIKAAHGQVFGFSGAVTADCGPKSSKSVELREPYALITVTVSWPCALTSTTVFDSGPNQPIAGTKSTDNLAVTSVGSAPQSAYRDGSKLTTSGPLIKRK